MLKKNFSSLGQLRTMDDNVKSQRSIDYLTDLTRERSLYRKDIQTKKKTSLLSLANKNLGKHFSNLQDAGLHYSFSYAQQIQISYSLQQVWPLYFLAP